MSTPAYIYLQPAFFSEKEKIIARYRGLTAYSFRYSTSVCGLKITNKLGEICLLPFQGQQVWRAKFAGKELTMKSMFEEPRPTREYLKTYGGFLLHCGATAMGCPGPRDNHPLHGELPNAPYHKAFLIMGEDKRGAYMGLAGEYQHTVAFAHNYIAAPLLKLYEESARMYASISIRNLKNTPMELMYLAHINFRPIDNGKLVYSTPCSPENIKVRSEIPAHVEVAAGYKEFLQELSKHPEKHNMLTPGLKFDPEVVLYLNCLPDKEGWAHSMQIHPDGYADFVSHKPCQLEHGIRWISRTPDQDALGLLLPATAEPEGYTAEKNKGNIKILPAGESIKFEIETGLLTPEEAREMERKIGQILKEKNPA